MWTRNSRVLRAQRRLLGTADYPKELKRGTGSVLTTAHMQSIRERYKRDELDSSFYGPRDWYMLTRRTMKRKGKTAVEDIQQVAEDLKSTDLSY